MLQTNASIKKQSGDKAIATQGSHSGKIHLSVIILTKNEENFIERCIRSVAWADEFVVLDSGSTDKTKEIAASLGANVYDQEWLGWSAQRTKAISLAKHDWVFVLEADEIVSPALADAIKEAFSRPLNDTDGFYLDRRDDFLGVLIPNMRRPSKNRSFVRIFNRRYSAYDPSMKVHEEVRLPGRSIPLKGVLLHWRDYTLHEHLATYNRYATIEAEELNEKNVRCTALTIFLRPMLRFLWCYIAKGAYRSGVQGLNYSMMKAISDYIRYAKLWEMQNVEPSLHPPVQIYQATPSPNPTNSDEA